MPNARSCGGQQFREAGHNDVHSMRAKRPCLPGTAQARPEVTCPGHEGFHTGNPAVHVSAAPIERINAATPETQRLPVGWRVIS